VRPGETPADPPAWPASRGARRLPRRQQRIPRSSRTNLPEIPAGTRESPQPQGRKARSRRESPPIPAQPASAMTGLSRRRSRVRVPSLPYKTSCKLASFVALLGAIDRRLCNWSRAHPARESRTRFAHVKRCKSACSVAAHGFTFLGHPAQIAQAEGQFDCRGARSALGTFIAPPSPSRLKNEWIRAVRVLGPRSCSSARSTPRPWRPNCRGTRSPFNPSHADPPHEGIRTGRGEFIRRLEAGRPHR